MTLMRTSVEENRRIGAMIAETANGATGGTAVLLPLRGVSMLDSPGGPFGIRRRDRACFDAIRAGLKPGVPVIELEANINDPVFADRATQVFLELSGVSGDPERSLQTFP